MAETAVVDNPDKGRLEVTLDGETAFAEYRLKDDAIVFPHTVVPKAFGGRGIGGALVRAGLDMARARGLWVIPTCSFFAAYIGKRPELHALVHPDFRDRLKP